MAVLGYIGALLMGMVLGLIGGGGSILTVPILHYLFGIEPSTATAYSLFVVGVTAAAGSAGNMKQGHVHWPSVLWFGLPSVAAVFVTRTWIMPALPEAIGPVSKGTALLVLFALLMVAAAVTMVRKAPPPKPSLTRRTTPALLLAMIEGCVVGGLTGLVGAGGGFLIIPALVILGGLGMKQAIGSSLVIIAIKSLLGFGGDLLSGLHVEWGFLLSCSATAVIGIVIGTAVGARIPADRLKPAFGWFVLTTGIAILATELWPV